MAVVYVYNIINLIFLAGIIALLIILYNRLEVVENRYLLIAAFGMGADMVAWYSISLTGSMDTALACLKFSVCGRFLFGIGFIQYIGKEYKSKYKNLIAAIWGISSIASFYHSIMADNFDQYLSVISMKNINGITILSAQREAVYYLHVIVAVGVGIWSSLLIFSSLGKHKGKLDNKTIIQALFYIIAIIVQGVSYGIYESNFGNIVNVTPITRAVATTIYVILSFKYNFLNYDKLAGRSLVKGLGAGFVILSEELEVLYANVIATDLFPDIEVGNKCTRELKSAIEKHEYQFTRSGNTYKLTADRIIENGHVEGYTLLMVDITDVVELERQAIANEEARKNLLTNISHELRTPLNVISGAADMIKTGDVTKETVMEYAEVVRIASVNLEDTLNNILTASSEFEKIQTSDMAPYSICTLIDNIVDMCNERVVRKKVSFSVTVANDIPVIAYGDDRRIRQVLLNVLSNAIRYTDDGTVSLKVSGEYLNDGRFEYIYTIRDTGKNVYKSDVEIEESISTGNELGVGFATGYGIGLMVAKKIANSFDGDLSVYSIKGKVNVYSIRVPSQLIDRKTLAGYNFADKMSVSICGESDEMYTELKKVCHTLGVYTDSFSGIQKIRKLNRDEKTYPFLIFDYEKFGKKIIQSEKAKEYVNVAVIYGNYRPEELSEDFIYVRAPLSILTLNKILLEYEKRLEHKGDYETAFMAPSAKVLVVDDNDLNLQIATNMIEQFKCSVDVAESGYECLDLLTSGKNYDIIFMDYMMEGMDGLETTHHIRKMNGQIAKVPILAFTANAVKGAKEKYLEGGMDDAVFKPANSEAFAKALKRYLPKDKIIYASVPSVKETEEAKKEFPVIEGINKDSAIKYTGGNLEMYISMLRTFVAEQEMKEDKLLEYERENNFKDFVVLSHGIKGISRTLGMDRLSSRMMELEKAGKEEDKEKIEAIISEVLSFYRKQAKAIVAALPPEEPEKTKRVPSDFVEKTLMEMHEHLEEFEMDEAEELFKKLWPAEYDDIKAPLMKELKESIERVDYYASLDYVGLLLDTYTEKE